MDVSVIIVNYKTCELTLQCLRSLFKYTHGVKMEVIVVDNASQDDTPYSIRREFPQVRVVESQENLGFGKANNLGNTYAIGKYLFLLNSDTIVIHNIVRQVFVFIGNTSGVCFMWWKLVGQRWGKLQCRGGFPFGNAGVSEYWVS